MVQDSIASFSHRRVLGPEDHGLSYGRRLPHFHHRLLGFSYRVRPSLKSVHRHGTLAHACRSRAVPGQTLTRLLVRGLVGCFPCHCRVFLVLHAHVQTRARLLHDLKFHYGCFDHQGDGRVDLLIALVPTFRFVCCPCDFGTLNDPLPVGYLLSCPDYHHFYHLLHIGSRCGLASSHGVVAA
jgi:hypothetical protein